MRNRPFAPPFPFVAALLPVGRFALVVACALPPVVACCLSSDALAAPPWVDRPLTLPEADWAFDFGAGIAHRPDPDDTALGMNLEMNVGLTPRVELGVRTGVRFGDHAERGLEADNFGRFFDRQYFDGDSGPIANPELRVRGALVRLPVFEL